MMTLVNDLGLYVCGICSKELSTAGALSLHVVKSHKITKEEYYIKYINKTDGICPICTTKTTFRNIVIGFDKYCSTKCSSNSDDTKRKYKNTSIERYGIDSPSKLQTVKDKMKTTCISRYGVEYISQLHETKEKSKITNLERYGYEFASQNDLVKKKIKSTMMDIYGVETSFKLPDVVKYRSIKLCSLYGVSKSPFTSDNVRLKSLETMNARYGISYTLSTGSIFRDSVNRKSKETRCINVLNKHIPLFNAYNCSNISYTNDTFSFYCNICAINIVEPYAITHLRLLANQNPCTSCNPRIRYVSNAENELYTYITSLGVDAIQSDRSIISPMELDIVIPSHKLAIEYNGLYSHSEEFKPMRYHLNKLELSAKQGYRLIHIFEDDWLYRNDIVKSRISSLLNKTSRLYARKCTISLISHTESTVFLCTNHIQGACNAKYRYGLYYNNELVSIMTFGTSRFNRSEHELIRFCNKLNTTVVGAAGKLFSYHIKHVHVDSIISFADRCWSVGNLYNTIGFSLDSVTKPGYSYVVSGKRHSRFMYQKHKLNAGNDINESEHMIMNKRQLFRIYDCGMLKYKWTKS